MEPGRPGTDHRKTVERRGRVMGELRVRCGNQRGSADASSVTRVFVHGRPEGSIDIDAHRYPHHLATLVQSAKGTCRPEPFGLARQMKEWLSHPLTMSEWSASGAATDSIGG
jgi:hypothetical protein